MRKKDYIRQLEADNEELCRAVIRLASENVELIRALDAMQREKKRERTEAWMKDIAEEV